MADSHRNLSWASYLPKHCTAGCCLPVTERFVTAALVKGRTGLTVRGVAALLVTRLGVVAT